MDARDEARVVIVESNNKLAEVLTDFFNDRSEGRLLVPEYYADYIAAMTAMSRGGILKGSNDLFEIAVDTIMEHYKGRVYVQDLEEIQPLFEDIISAVDDRFAGVAQVGDYKKKNDIPAYDETQHKAVILGFVNKMMDLGGDKILAEKLMRNMADYCADQQKIYIKEGNGPIFEALELA